MIRLSSNEYDFNNRIRIHRMSQHHCWRIQDLETMEYFSLDDEGTPWWTNDLADAIDVVYQNRLHKKVRPAVTVKPYLITV